MRTTDTVNNYCWSCGMKFEAASDLVGDKKPKAGDFSFCIKCAVPGVFSKDLSTRKPTEEEMRDILNNPEAVRYMLAIKMLHMGEKA